MKLIHIFNFQLQIFFNQLNCSRKIMDFTAGGFFSINIQLLSSVKWRILHIYLCLLWNQFLCIRQNKRIGFTTGFLCGDYILGRINSVQRTIIMFKLLNHSRDCFLQVTLLRFIHVENLMKCVTYDIFNFESTFSIEKLIVLFD